MIRLSITRPIAVAMAYLALSILGIAAWRNLPVELLPDTQLPRLSISATWPGASPETTEAFLTAPMEAAIQQVRGVERISSESTEGRASITVDFQRQTDMDFARLEMSERLDALQDDLPAAASPPLISAYIPPEFEEQTRPFLEYTVTGPYTTEALRAQVDSLIVGELLQVDGIGDIRVFGGRERLIEIELDEARVQAFGLTLARVRQTLQNSDYVRDAGVVELGGLRQPLAIRHRIESLADLRALPVHTQGGRVVRLQDIGRVLDSWEEPRSHYRIDGQPAISFTVVREIGTNAVEVADRAKEALAGLAATQAPGVRLILDSDESEAIRTQLSELRTRAIFSALVIFIVLLGFLRSIRSAGLVFATVAFSVLITLNGIYWSGMSLNVLTLMGLAMGFGLIVDNAIVVLENVYRHRRSGADADEAAARGTREVVLPVLSATLTTLIVVVPFVYLQGELRLFYLPLAVVVGLALIASIFVAFTFIPALGARILRRVPASAVDGPGAAPLYARFYSALTGLTLRFPWTTVLVALAILAGSWHLFDQYVNRGVVWSPFWSQRSFVRVSISLPRGEELARTDEMARFFEERIAPLEGVDRFVTNVRPENATITVTFPDSLELTSIPLLVQDHLAAYAFNLGGARISVVGQGPAFSAGSLGGASPNYRIQIFGYNYEEVRDIGEDLGRRLSAFSRIEEVDTNASSSFSRDRVTEMVVTPDRARLALNGLSSREFLAQVSAAVAGSEGRISVMRVAGDEARFAIKLEGHDAMDVVGLRDLSISGIGGGSARLGDVADIRERDVLGQVLRENQQYQRTIAYEFRGPARLGDVIRDAVIENTHLPPGYRIETRQLFRLSDEEQQQIYAVLALALILVFMLSAAVFESVRQPLCVLLTVPMAMVGVFLIFFYANASFTREAYIGVIMMAGIVVNNAILLVDHINRLRRETALDLKDAVLTGAIDRARPILMTTATTVFGLLPLVLFTPDADARIWNALGYALIGGLASSTLFVLTVTPAVYLLLERGVRITGGAACVADARLRDRIPDLENEKHPD